MTLEEEGREGSRQYTSGIGFPYFPRFGDMPYLSWGGLQRGHLPVEAGPQGPPLPRWGSAATPGSQRGAIIGGELLLRALKARICIDRQEGHNDIKEE